VGVVALVASATASAGTVDATATGAPQGNVVPALVPVSGVGAAATSAPVDGRVAILIQNGSSKPARVDLVTATATRADGGQVVRAGSTKAFPQALAPGELALASAQFRRNDVRPDAQIVVKVKSTPVTPSRVERAPAVGGLVLSAPKSGSVAQTLDATVTNPTTNWTARRTRIAVMCFGESRQPSTITTAPVTPPKLKAGQQVAISVPLTTLCPTYLVAARAS
jgi:hypothetical protein